MCAVSGYFIMPWEWRYWSFLNTRPTPPHNYVYGISIIHFLFLASSVYCFSQKMSRPHKTQSRSRCHSIITYNIFMSFLFKLWFSYAIFRAMVYSFEHIVLRVLDPPRGWNEEMRALLNIAACYECLWKRIYIVRLFIWRIYLFLCDQNILFIGICYCLNIRWHAAHGGFCCTLEIFTTS